MQPRPVGDHEPRPFGYYEPPPSQRGRPAVITWLRVYAVTILALYLGIFALWQFLTPAGPNEPSHGLHATPAGVATVVVLGLLVVGFAALHAVAAFVPYKPWGWTVGLLAICLGLSSCTALAAVPLLVFWLKPETKAAFGRL